MGKRTTDLRIPAIEVQQSPGRVLYSFAIDGKLLPRIASISRIRRDEGSLAGYQRPEVLSHISQIREYLESESPMIPNAVVIAFDSRVRFEPLPGQPADLDYSRHGTLIIPDNAELINETKPGFVVDGQQRLAAVREADITSFPMPVSAFITDDVREQKEQFILVNSTKPLPKGLIYELLPDTDARLPTLLEQRRFPAHLAERMNHDEASPLKGLIRTPTTPEGKIKDNSILRMLENSLSDGALYRFRGRTSVDHREEEMLQVLYAFWGAVAQTFPEAWEERPRRSRLVHGAGIVSMGFLMDAIADRLRATEIPTKQQFAEDLAPLVQDCSWTNGHWNFGPGQVRKWNEIQNTSKDIYLLSNFLLVKYKERVWTKAA